MINHCKDIMGGPGIQVDGGELEWDGSGGCGGKHSSTYGKWGEGFVSWLLCGSTNPWRSRKSRVYFTYIYRLSILTKCWFCCTILHPSVWGHGISSLESDSSKLVTYQIPSIPWMKSPGMIPQRRLPYNTMYDITLPSVHPSIHLSSSTLQGTNISPKNGILKMIFLFPRWDMLIP